MALEEWMSDEQTSGDQYYSGFRGAVKSRMLKRSNTDSSLQWRIQSLFGISGCANAHPPFSFVASRSATVLDEPQTEHPARRTLRSLHLFTVTVDPLFGAIAAR